MRVAFTVKTDDLTLVPKVGDTLSSPVENGSVWFTLGTLVATQVVPGGVAFTVELAEGVTSP